MRSRAYMSSFIISPKEYGKAAGFAARMQVHGFDCGKLKIVDAIGEEEVVIEVKSMFKRLYTLNVKGYNCRYGEENPEGFSEQDEKDFEDGFRSEWNPVRVSDQFKGISALTSFLRSAVYQIDDSKAESEAVEKIQIPIEREVCRLLEKYNETHCWGAFVY